MNKQMKFEKLNSKIESLEEKKTQKRKKKNEKNGNYPKNP